MIKVCLRGDTILVIPFQKIENLDSKIWTRLAQHIPKSLRKATLLKTEHLPKSYFAHTLSLLHRSYPKCLFLGCINTTNWNTEENKGNLMCFKTVCGYMYTNVSSQKWPKPLAWCELIHGNEWLVPGKCFRDQEILFPSKVEAKSWCPCEVSPFPQSEEDFTLFHPHSLYLSTVLTGQQRKAVHKQWPRELRIWG